MIKGRVLILTFAHLLEGALVRIDSIDRPRVMTEAERTARKKGRSA